MTQGAPLEEGIQIQPVAESRMALATRHSQCLATPGESGEACRHIVEAAQHRVQLATIHRVNRLV